MANICKVSELIEALKAMPQDGLVYVEADYGRREATGKVQVIDIGEGTTLIRCIGGYMSRGGSPQGGSDE